MSSSPRRLDVLLAALLCAPVLLHAQPTPFPFPFQDRTLPIDERIDDLVSRMTLEEKASQMVNRTRAIPRLNVPEYNIWSEALHGVAGGGFATVFPQAIGLAATFDAPTLHEMAQATAREARVKYNQAAKAGRAGRMMGGLTFYSPNINIFRDPRWGRGQETYGEDPFLSGRPLNLAIRGAVLSGKGTLRRLAPQSLTANVVVGQEPGVRIDEQSLTALPANPTFAPHSVNIYEFPAK